MLASSSLNATTGDEGTSFLMLLWREMFAPTTPDTFQPRLFNIPLLVQELGEISSRAEIDKRWERHLCLIQDEIRDTIREDSTFLERLPFYTANCRRLADLKNTVEIQHLAKFLSESEASFRSAAEDDFVQTAATLPTTKANATRALRRLATIALNCGFDTTNSELIRNDRMATEAPRTWAERFVAELRSNTGSITNFDCILPVSGLTENMVRWMLKFKTEFSLLVRSDLPFDRPREWQRTVFFELNNVPAKSGAEALRAAVRLLRPKLDILGFYDPAQAPSFGDSGAVKMNGTWQILKIGGRTLRDLPPRKHSLKLTENALAIPPHLLTGRILNALEHHSLARANTAHRIKLANLWSALECLSESGESGANIFDRVQDTVVPIVVWRRTDKIARYLASNLSRVRREEGADFGAHFDKSGTVTAEEMFLWLAKGDADPHLPELFRAVGRHPLLVNRLHTLRDLFKDPRGLLKDLDASAKRTRWHLARIYRARNLIVHEGYEIAAVRHLVDNLQYYLSVTVSRILHRIVRAKR